MELYDEIMPRVKQNKTKNPNNIYNVPEMPENMSKRIHAQRTLTLFQKYSCSFKKWNILQYSAVTKEQVKHNKPTPKITLW